MTIYLHATREQKETFPLAAGHPATFLARELVAGLRGFSFGDIMISTKKRKEGATCVNQHQDG